MSLEAIIKAQFSKRVYLCKRITLSKDAKMDLSETERIIHRLFDYIHFFNSQYVKDGVSILGGKSWNEIPVCNEFKDFILPNSVRYDPADRAWTDLISKREEIKEADISKLSYQDYIETLIVYKSLFKDSITNNVSYLSDVKKDVSLSDVISRSIRDDKCIFNNTPFVPIEINGVVELDANALHYNYYVDDMIADYMLSINW